MSSLKQPSFLGLKGQGLVYGVTFCCSIGFLLFGWDLAFLGSVVTSPVFLNQFGNPTGALLGFFVSSYEVGAMFGALFQFFLGDRYGRRVGIIVGGAVLIVGAILQTAAFSTAQFLVGRLIAGFGLGSMTTVIPVWLSECTMPKSRGRMMAMQLSNLIMGLILANWVTFGVSTKSGSVQWRFPCAFQIVFCILVMGMAPLLPESPRYLCVAEQYDRAAYNLAALRGAYPDSPQVERELSNIKYAIAVEKEDQAGWSEVFKDGGISGSTRVTIAFMAK